jgi:hypothetical protein
VILLLLAALLLTFFLCCHYASPPFPLREELLPATMNLSATLRQHKEAKTKKYFLVLFYESATSTRVDDNQDDRFLHHQVRVEVRSADSHCGMITVIFFD